jgi:hypothetical protein
VIRGHGVVGQALQLVRLLLDLGAPLFVEFGLLLLQQLLRGEELPSNGYEPREEIASQCRIAK